MTLLSDHAWRAHYTSSKHDLLHDFYLPALACGRRYDRKTGYFNARALHLAARGLEGLVRNEGHMRLLVGCTLDAPEVKAIELGTSVREAVAQRTAALDPRGLGERDALELLAWMVSKGFLEVKVAVPCGDDRKPVASDAIFHVKAGVIQDKTGDRLGFSGSINETAAGWRGNIESFHVYADWKGEESKSHLDAEDEDFSTLWADKAPHALVVDVPSAVRDDLLRFLPAEGKRPRRLEPTPPVKPLVTQPGEVREDLADLVPPPPPPTDELRRLVWGIIRHGPAIPGLGDRVGEATCAVQPWPHQVRAFERMYGEWPPRLLIADEVGLGKTIEAGLLLRQAWLAGRAKRILILAPRAVLRQWQIELREKFNLNWPIYDGRALCWYPSKALHGATEREVGRDAWHREPCVIASSQLVRRADRAAEVLEQAEPYDLVVLDEAHHARRHSPGAAKDKGPNRLLALMQRLRERTKGLLLLTATPMQVHPIEVYDLLALLGLPPEWTPEVFLSYFELAASDNPSHEAMDRMCALLRSIETAYRPADESALKRVDAELSTFAARKILKALRADASTPRRHLEARERLAAVRFLRRQTPVGRLVSRHTRALLRRYQQEGRLDLKIAERDVEDVLVRLSPAERDIYERVEDYISTTYNNASPAKRNAVGFIMTVYRKRLASSFAALARTLEARHGRAGAALLRPEEDVSDDEVDEEPMDPDEALGFAGEALVAEERTEIDKLLRDVRRLPTDTKAKRLVDELRKLRGQGYAQAIVFTQFTDTIDFLRELLAKEGRQVACFSGRGGERRATDGSWLPISRDDAKRLFRTGDADLLLCTDAAAEGLNFQFCGALINYDAPWNPMRVEQRIGRIDRLGQRFDRVRIVNLLYEDTVEADAYLALRERIGLFEQFVGRLQPILSRLSGRISRAALARRGDREQVRLSLVQELQDEASRPPPGGLDLDEAADADLTVGVRPPPLFDLDDLEALFHRPDLLPPGMSFRPLHEREYAVSVPGLSQPVRATTSAAFYEDQPESTELWSPGNPLFEPPGAVASPEEVARSTTPLRALLGEPSNGAAPS